MSLTAEVRLGVRRKQVSGYFNRESSIFPVSLALGKRAAFASPGGENSHPPETIPLPLASRKFPRSTGTIIPRARIIITLSFTTRSRVDCIDRLSMLHSAKFIQLRNLNFSDKTFNTATRNFLDLTADTRIPCR